jgi:hypothetical protein
MGFEFWLLTAPPFLSRCVRDASLSSDLWNHHWHYLVAQGKLIVQGTGCLYLLSLLAPSPPCNPLIHVISHPHHSFGTYITSDLTLRSQNGVTPPTHVLSSFVKTCEAKACASSRSFQSENYQGLGQCIEGTFRINLASAGKSVVMVGVNRVLNRPCPPRWCYPFLGQISMLFLNEH